MVKIKIRFLNDLNEKKTKQILENFERFKSKKKKKKSAKINYEAWVELYSEKKWYFFNLSKESKK